MRHCGEAEAVNSPRFGRVGYRKHTRETNVTTTHPHERRGFAGARAGATALALLGLCGGLLTGTALAADKRPPPVAQQPPPADSCAVARGTVRMEAYGYTHLVTLENGCTKAVECALWTNVDPEPRQVVQTAPGERVEIITRRGSPAREVTALKSCKYR